MMRHKSSKSVAAHGVILMVDINRFGKKELTDKDRGRLRFEIQEMISETFTKAAIKHKECFSQDTGDGILLIFPPNLDKTSTVKKIIPDLTDRLVERNRVSADFIKMRVRAVLHFGEYFRDKPKITKSGVTGDAINVTARLLDSDFLRSWVRTSEQSVPLCLLVSNEFYESVVRQQMPELASKFTQHDIGTKDRTLKAWAFNYVVGSKTQLNGPQSLHGGEQTTLAGKIEPLSVRSHSGRKEEKELFQLEGRTLILSTFDIHNYNLYKRIAETKPLRNHLETSLLLSSKVVIHCSDPYRSKEVLELLYEYQDFVKRGEILFLLGSTIHNVRSDYKAYLERKADQYLTSGYGEQDIDMLKARLEDDVYLDKVIDLLEMSPILLHRGYGGTERFVDLVRRDFEPTEKIATTYGLLSSKVRRLNLSLYQILHLQEIQETGKTKAVFGKRSELRGVIEKLENRINSKSFSRQILMGLFMKSLNRTLRYNDPYYNLIESRINLLHLHINVDKHTFIEFNPERDKNSPYYYKYLLNHLGSLSKQAPKETVGAELIKQLKELPSWNHFVNCHLSIMAGLYARRLADLEVGPERYFYETQRNREFTDIYDTLNSSWR